MPRGRRPSGAEAWPIAVVFFMEGRRIWVDWNRVFSSSFLALEPITRVLIIEGPTPIVNVCFFDRLFKRKLKKFDTEEVILEEITTQAGGVPRARITWRFGSWYDQAEIAAQQLQARYRGAVEVGYGLDMWSGVQLNVTPVSLDCDGRGLEGPGLHPFAHGNLNMGLGPLSVTVLETFPPSQYYSFRIVSKRDLKMP